MFLSIVIPIYNVEKYLNQCVDSVIEQNLVDYEIILVDDGSPDNSPKICDDYAEKYDFVRVIHKQNGGLSSARNAGIKIAQGTYIMFLDSDDWWNSEVNLREVLDKVRCNSKIEMFLMTSLDYVDGKGFYRRKEHERLKNISTRTVEEYYQSLLDNGNLEVSAGTKILKTDFLRTNNLYFKVGIKGEDNEWMIRLLRCLEAVGVISEPIYLCRLGREGSITNTINEKNIKDLLKIVEESLKYYQMNSDKEFLKGKELCFAAYLWFCALGLSTRLLRKDRVELQSLFEKTKGVCDYSNSRKTKYCGVLYKIAGYQMTARILGLYIKLKSKFKISREKAELN